MGCFDSMCAISGLPIKYRQPAGLIFSLQNEKSYSINDGPFQYWKPLTFPIHGTYNDYGSLEKIERSWNVEILEDFYGLPIDKILECHNKNYTEEELYKWVGHDNVLSFLKKPIKYSYRLTTREDLINLGFEFINDEDFIHPRLDRNLKNKARQSEYLTQYSFSLKNGKVEYSTTGKFIGTKKTYWMKDFSVTGETDLYSTLNQVWGKILLCGREPISDYNWLGLTDEEAKKFVLLNTTNRMFIDRDAWNFVSKKSADDALYGNQSWVQSSKKRLRELFDLCTVPPPPDDSDWEVKWKHTDRILNNCHRLTLTNFDKLYYPYISQGKLDKDVVFSEYVAMKNLEAALDNTCRYFMPTGHGFVQHYDFGAKVYYEKEFLKILKKRQKDEDS